MQNIRVFPPLKQGHPACSMKCWICSRSMSEGTRVVLKATQTQADAGSLTVEAKIVHATCALRGVEFTYGIIDYIKDGDGSPYEVVMTNGKQFKLSELELE